MCLHKQARVFCSFEQPSTPCVNFSSYLLTLFGTAQRNLEKMLFEEWFRNNFEKVYLKKFENLKDQ